MSNLQYRHLTEANAIRCSHYGHDLTDWSPTDWACALAGEVGELCNFIKKMRRGDTVDPGDVEKELADVAIYLDLLAQRLGVNLGDAIIAKFNQSSRKIGSPVRLSGAGMIQVTDNDHDPSALRDDIPTDPEPLHLGWQGMMGQAFSGDRTGLRRRGDLLGLQVFEDLDNPQRPLTMVSPDGSQRVEFRDTLPSPNPFRADLARMAKKDDFWAEALRYYDAERTPAAAEDQGGPEEPPAQIL